MEIKKDFVEWKGFNRTANISEIVIHATAGGNTIDYVKSGARKKEYEKKIGLFHFCIEESGAIIQILPVEQWVYHSSSSRHDKVTLAIECEKADAHNSKDLNENQYNSLLWLLDNLIKEHPINSIVSHDFNAKVFSKKAPKPCPGTFQWDKLKERFANIKINY